MKVYDPIIVLDFLVNCCNHYLKSAPVVSRWAEEIHFEIQESPEKITLRDLVTMNMLSYDDGNWVHPNYATNIVYKRIVESGRDSTGLLSF